MMKVVLIIRYQEIIKNPPAYLKPRDQIGKVESKGTL